MVDLLIERFGGLAGVGGPHARIRSVGQVDLRTLSDQDRATLEALFGSEASPARSTPDAFRYRITRLSDGQTIEVSHDALPEAVSSAVRDRLV